MCGGMFGGGSNFTPPPKAPKESETPNEGAEKERKKASMARGWGSTWATRGKDLGAPAVRQPGNLQMPSTHLGRSSGS